MTVPVFQDLMLPVLRASQEGEVRIGAVVEKLEKELNLSDSDRTEILPSGQQTIFSKLVATSGNGSGSGHAFENNQQTTGGADLARDYGFSAWIDANPKPYLDMELGYTRSINYDLNAVSFGIGVNVGDLIRKRSNH